METTKDLLKKLRRSIIYVTEQCQELAGNPQHTENLMESSKDEVESLNNNLSSCTENIRAIFKQEGMKW